MKRKRRGHRFVSKVGECGDRRAEYARVDPRAGNQDEHRNRMMIVIARAGGEDVRPLRLRGDVREGGR